ncbi:MAG: MFS transporter [Bacteroidia bacterium]|nr:MFS transporter [Bacteroidia bacterium]
MYANEEARASMYSTQFWLLCLSNFLFSASFQMLIPELPDYLSSLGGAEYKGYLIGLFTLTAGISRPFSGKLADTIGRVPVMVFGTLVCVVCGLAYPMMMTVGGLLLLRTLHGFSTGFKPTATSAYISDIAPVAQRGEAMSIAAISAGLGMSFAPPVGSWIAQQYGMNVLFYTSTVLALGSIVILTRGLYETLPDRQPFRWSLLRMSRKDLFEPAVMGPFVVTLLVSFSSGVAITLTPDLSKGLGLSNKGIFFLVSTLAALLVRVVAAKSSDRRGRLPVLLVSAAGLAVSLGWLGAGQDTPSFILASLLYGASWGVMTPTLQAWTIDLSTADNRGRALATMYIALEAGIGLGAWTSAWLYHNEAARMGISFYLAGGLALLAMGYLARKQQSANSLA